MNNSDSHQEEFSWLRTIEHKCPSDLSPEDIEETNDSINEVFKSIDIYNKGTNVLVENKGYIKSEEFGYVNSLESGESTHNQLNLAIRQMQETLFTIVEEESDSKTPTSTIEHTLDSELDCRILEESYIICWNSPLKSLIQNHTKHTPKMQCMSDLKGMV